MEQIREISDMRLRGRCVFCGGVPETRDHVPPRVFLDAPLPENLAVVESCLQCNNSASLDEEYLACLVEVARCGTIDPIGVERPKVTAILERKPALALRIGETFIGHADVTVIEPEEVRMRRVIRKIAVGLAAFELGGGTTTLRADVRVAPFSAMDDAAIEAFFDLHQPDLLPEVGSRMMLRVLTDVDHRNRWEIVQAGRFGYGIECHGALGRIKMDFSSFLAAEVDLENL